MSKQYKKRADGRYYTTVGTKRINDKGKEIRIPVYGKSLTEFKDNIAETKAAIKNGTYAYDKGTTFKSYKEHWLKVYIMDTSLSYKRKESYKNTCKNHVGTLDDLKLGEILPSHVQAGFNKLNGHLDLQNEYKMTVNRIFKAAIADHLIAINPADGIKVSKPKRDKKKNRALTPLERELIPTVAWTPKERCFLAVLQYAGPRRGEILALTKRDIDFANNVIDINKAIYFKGQVPTLKDPKTFKGYREIDILDPLMNVLKDYVNTLHTLILFPNQYGGMMTEGQYKRFWNRIRLKLNVAAGGTYEWKHGWSAPKFPLNMIPNFTSKVFRHEYATILYYSGVDLKEAIRLFGHEDSKTLTDIYAELRIGESKSSEKLNNYLKTKYA